MDRDLRARCQAIAQGADKSRVKSSFRLAACAPQSLR
jgi:hypothetical protein